MDNLSFHIQKVCANAKRVVCETGDHRFLCKRCNVAFPLLESLRLHIVLKHAVKADEEVEATVFSSVNLVDKREQGAKPPQVRFLTNRYGMTLLLNFAGSCW